MERKRNHGSTSARRRQSLATAVVASLLLGGCATMRAEYAPEPDEADDVTTTQSGVDFVVVAERFVSPATPRDNVDSPASWRHPDGSTWVLATAKATDLLIVYDGDSGERLRAVGGSGSGPGELDRPNGIFVIDDVAFVVERDNHRVQAFSLPTLQPLGHFGTDTLRKPYGLWMRRQADGYDVIVSDAYMSEADDDLPPPTADLGERYKRYRVSIADGSLRATQAGHIGSVEPAGAIRIPESLFGDETHDRLLLAEEDQADGTRLKLHDLDGRYQGIDIGRGLFHAQAEGIALWQCADGSGYWIATDQYKDRSVFHLFDRVSLRHVGAFAGHTVANTDGVWLQQASTRAFDNGVFYAVHDDQAIAAFDWTDIAAGLGLRRNCGSE